MLVSAEVAVVKPFRALRYDVAKAGQLEDLIAPPYDVIGADERERLRARSPYNVVRLTLPDEEADAARDLAAWRSEGVVAAEEPTAWVLAQDYVGPDGVARTRVGLVAALRLEPYEHGVVLPHERTHRGPKEGRLRLLRATRTQLEPIFLLHDGPRFDAPAEPPDLEVEGTRLWRAEASVLAGFDDRQLLIADGHHRYETALAFHAEDATEASAWMMVVLVSTRDPGLTIFPTHRVVGSLPELDGGLRVTTISGGVEDAVRLLEGLSRDHPAFVAYRGGAAVLVEAPDEPPLDVALIDRIGPGDVTYTPYVDDAVMRVDRGEAEAALLVRPPTIEQVRAVATAGETMPQKSTFFYPKLVSGLLLQPLD